tara:strand:- start:60 stop:488 length:429 start_codon:yes stop_codon:yes gene_type:complete
MKKYKNVEKSKSLLCIDTLENKELERDPIEDCYICLEEITHETAAVFPHRCKHSICISCLKLLGKSKTRQMLENTSRCGICRVPSNKYIMRSKAFATKKHNSSQSIFVPTELFESKKKYPHYDFLQQMIVQGYILDNQKVKN